MALRCTRVFVTGKVQGVFYRQSCKEEATRLGLCGFVRNLPDGRVEALFCGPSEAVEKAIAWCRRGPPLAVVESLQTREEEITEKFDDFRILRG